MNLQKQHKSLLKEKDKINTLLDKSFKNFMKKIHKDDIDFSLVLRDEGNLEELDIGIFIKSDHEDYKHKHYFYYDYNVHIRFRKFNTEYESSSLQFHLPSYHDNFLDSSKDQASEEFLENSQRILELIKSVKCNLDKVRPELIDLFEIKNDLIQKESEIENIEEEIQNNSENDIIDEVRKTLNIADSDKSQELFEKITFDKDEDFFIIKMEIEKNEDGSTRLVFRKNHFSIECDGRITCRRNDSIFARAKIRAEFDNAVLFNGELDQTFASLQNAVNIPSPRIGQRKINIFYDDFLNMVKEEDTPVKFLKKKEKNYIQMLTNRDSKSKKRPSFYGLK